jgi:hypothetical protein
MKPTPTPLIICSMALFLCGCNDNTAETGKVTIEEVFQSAYCGVSEPTGYIIANEAQWRRITQGGQRLLRDSPATQTNSRFQALAEESLLVLLAAGQKPSAGYSIRVETSAWSREQNELLLNVVQGSPAADSMQAAVITSPCVVIAIGNYHGLEQLRFSGFDSELAIQLSAGN